MSVSTILISTLVDYMFMCKGMHMFLGAIRPEGPYREALLQLSQDIPLNEGNIVVILQVLMRRLHG
jgi:hypothetical protein